MEKGSFCFDFWLVMIFRLLSPRSSHPPLEIRCYIFPVTTTVLRSLRAGNRRSNVLLGPAVFSFQMPMCSLLGCLPALLCLLFYSSQAKTMNQLQTTESAIYPLLPLHSYFLPAISKVRQRWQQAQGFYHKLNHKQGPENTLKLLYFM